MSNQFISQYTALAEASYANFSGKDFNNKEAIKKAIVNTNDKKPGSEKFAESIAESYSVLAHREDKADNHSVDSVFSAESGFSGTLFRSKTGANAGEYVLALKGTDGKKDLLISDAADIVHDGLAHHQIVDRYNFWQQITHKSLSVN